MDTGQPSHTALLVAMARAAHQILDIPPIFEDPIALSIVGVQNSAQISAAPEAYRTRSAKAVRAYLVARSKYVELALADAVRRGMRQYAILGAGLDTFAYRNPYAAEVLSVFEVDHPLTQAWKRAQLEAAGIPIPPSLKFVSINFEQESLADRLPAGGFNPAEPAFFSWMGVSMYLPGEAVWATLQSVNRLAPPGSELVFDYTLSPSLLSPAEVLSFQVRAARVAAAGEPWKSTFEPDQIAADLRGMGFTVVEDLGASELNPLFFAQRTDGLRVDGRARLVKCLVNERQG